VWYEWKNNTPRENQIVFKGLPNLTDLMKQAGRIRGEMERLSEELKRVEVEGTAGGGMVKVRVNGKQEVLSCQIDRQVLDDQDCEFLEDLIVAAVNQSLDKSRETATERLGQLSGGLNIPGLAQALGQFGGGGGNS
jgi:DNA-binding YbaB/EbfC family protein